MDKLAQYLTFGAEVYQDKEAAAPSFKPNAAWSRAGSVKAVDKSRQAASATAAAREKAHNEMRAAAYARLRKRGLSASGINFTEEGISKYMAKKK